jgi:hypothetical protein
MKNNIEFSNIEDFKIELSRFLTKNTEYIQPCTQVSVSLLEKIKESTQKKLDVAINCICDMSGDMKTNTTDNYKGVIRTHWEAIFSGWKLSRFSPAMLKFYKSMMHITPRSYCEDRKVEIIDDLKGNK